MDAKIAVVADALYLPDRDRHVPTPATGSPWDPRTQHGGPVAALIVREVERHVADAPLPQQVTRLTVELARPVPVAPLTLSVRTVRAGARVRFVEAVVDADGDRVARAQAVCLRVTDLPTRDVAPPVTPPPAPVRADPPVEWGWPAFHTDGVELAFVAGEFTGPGPAQVWIRLRLPLVPGEQPSPVQRAAAAADFANGVSAVLPFDRWLFINADLSVWVERPPDGEWIGLDARSHLTGRGIAVAAATLFDAGGRIGQSAQTLLVDRR